MLEPSAIDNHFKMSILMPYINLNQPMIVFDVPYKIINGVV